MKTWCKHIYFSSIWKKWMFKGESFKLGTAFVPNNFKFCPICGTKRPTKKKRIKK